MVADADFRADVRRFIQRHLPTDLQSKVMAHQRLGKEDFLRWHRILFEQGWVAPGWPKAFGGAAWTIEQRNIFDEECGLAGAPETQPFGLRMVGPVIMAYGSPWQKAHFLPRILSGEDWWCQGYSEPGAGSDLASLRTRARRQGDHYLISGQKTWTTYAQHADMMFCLARTDPQAKPQEGISFFLIDMRSPGVSLRPIRTLDGGEEINEVFLDDVAVPLSHLVGEENRGWTYAKYLLSHERFGAARVGRAKRELGLLKTMARQCIRQGRSALEDPILARRVTLLEIDTLALEQTNLRLIDQDKRGAGHGAEASMLKYLGSTLAQRISEVQLDLAGPLGLAYRSELLDAEMPGQTLQSVPGFYLNLRKISIYGGTDEVQKNIIAKLALGRAVADVPGQEMVEASLGAYLARAYPPRGSRPEAASTGIPAHWRALAELGMTALALPVSHGGLEQGALALCAAAQCLGRHGVDEPYATSAVLAGSLLARLPLTPALLTLCEGLASGEVFPAVILPGPQAGSESDAVRARRCGSGWVLEGRARLVPYGTQASHWLVVAPAQDEYSLFLLDAGCPGVSGTACQGLDGRDYAELALHDCRVADTACFRLSGEDLSRAVDLTRIVLCAEALGAMGWLLDATQAYLAARQQFGRPLGSFQVLQHRLVDMLLLLEQARALTWHAAETSASAAAVLERLASAAKAKCGEAARLIGQQSIHLHGGMGMTDELPVGHYVKRLMAIEYTLGDTAFQLERYEASTSAAAMEHQHECA